MKQIFWGLIFVYFHINLSLDGFVLQIFPAFVGYLLILNGVQRLAEMSGAFRRTVKPVQVMAVWSAVCFALGLLGDPQEGFGSLGTAVFDSFQAAALVLGLVVLYQVALGMADIEMQSGSGEMRTGRLLYAWKICAAVTVINLPLAWLAEVSGSSSLALLCIGLAAADLGAAACYLVFYHTAWRTYESMPFLVADCEWEV